MTITLTIDGQEVTAEAGKTLLEVARENGKDIPTICFHEATTANALCRICVVEVEGMRVLQPACIVEAAKDMKVQTRSEKVIRARKTILEMLASTMDLSEAPEIQAMMNEYGADRESLPRCRAPRSRSQRRQPDVHPRLLEVPVVLALCAGLRGRCAVYVRDQLRRSRL